jgi:hypothetical protein
MVSLNDCHPDIYTEFMKGKFTVRNSKHAFSAIAGRTIDGLPPTGAALVEHIKLEGYFSGWSLLHDYISRASITK